MKYQSLFVLLVIFVVLFSGCQPSDEEIAAAVAQTIEAMATETPEPTETPRSTNTPHPTNTLQPTSTPSPTITPTPTKTVRPTNTPKPTATELPPNEKIGRVIGVVDGDTITVSIDNEVFSVRYIGLNAPDMTEPCGSEAREANADLVSYKRVRLVEDGLGTDENESLLRYVYVEDLFVNGELVRTGWASVTEDAPNTSEGELLKSLAVNAPVPFCPTPTATLPPTATPVPTSTPDPRGLYAEVDARDLEAYPYDYRGELIRVRGRVFNVIPGLSSTSVQIWINGGSVAVYITWYGDEVAPERIYEGDWITVYGVGTGTIEGTNSFGATIVQPSIEAHIIEK